MAIAAYLSGAVLEGRQLPLKLCAMSRCYRRESSNLESHLYRVHQFNKVALTTMGFMAVASRFVGSGGDVLRDEAARQ